MDILLQMGVATIPIVMITTMLTYPLTVAGGAIVITYAAAYERFVEKPRQKRLAALEQLKAEARAEGLEQGRAEGIAQGIAQGQVQGQAQANQRFAEWWQKLQQAQRDGLPFDEPPPFNE